MKIKVAFPVRGFSKEACYHLSGLIRYAMQQTGKDEVTLYGNQLTVKTGFLSYTTVAYGVCLDCRNGIVQYVGYGVPAEPEDNEIFQILFKQYGVK